MSRYSDCVTVIVAVYNVEKYIERCLASICNQTYQNLEIIVVDDGSTDESGRLCDKVAEADCRIHVIHKKNGGISSARNAGLDIATGDYVVFVDGDDYLEMDMYEKMVAQLQHSSVQMAVCSFQYVYERKIKCVKPPLGSGTITRNEYIRGLLEDSFAFYYSVVWNKMFQRTLIQKYGLRFDEDWNVMEDFQFVLQILPHVKNMAMCTGALYNYRKNNYGTATNREIPFEESYRNRCQGYLWLKDCLIACDYYTDNKDMLADYLVRYIANQYVKAVYSGHRKERMREHTLIVKRRFITAELEAVSKWFLLYRKGYWTVRYLAEGMVQQLRKVIRNR